MASGGVTTGKKTLWALLLGTVLPLAASAALRVVVRVPTLHSLVAALTRGGIEPGLLMGTRTTRDEALGDQQEAELLAADIIIQAGAGPESGLGEVLGRMPALARECMALTGTIRLLARAPAFWTATRLAMLVVHQITPQLVRLAPEHQDLSLDNAIALMMQLNGLEAEIADRLGPALSLSADRWARIDPDFRHRVLDSAMTHPGIRLCREACQLGRRLSGQSRIGGQAQERQSAQRQC